MSAGHHYIAHIPRARGSLSAKWRLTIGFTNKVCLTCAGPYIKNVLAGVLSHNGQTIRIRTSVFGENAYLDIVGNGCKE